MAPWCLLNVFPCDDDTSERHRLVLRVEKYDVSFRHKLHDVEWHLPVLALGFCLNVFEHGALDLVGAEAFVVAPGASVYRRCLLLRWLSLLMSLWRYRMMRAISGGVRSFIQPFFVLRLLHFKFFLWL